MESLINFLSSIVDFILNQLGALIWAITMIPQLVQSVVDILAYAPGFLTVFLDASIAVMVLFAVLKLGK